MFHFGFSYVGLIYLLMLFIPNIVWAKNRPVGYEQYTGNENKFLMTLERIGEILVCICALVFSDFNIRKTYWAGWLVLSFLFMVLYEIYWIRYFRSEKSMKEFYRSLIGFKVPEASLPVITFFLLGIYGSNAPMLISAIILGIGHIEIHILHRNEVYGKRKRKLPFRILKWILAAFGIVIVLIFLFVIGNRNINFLRHYKLVQSGVDEADYLMLGGQEQYVQMRGMNTENPVIIYLHGGPSSPDAYTTYGFSDFLLDDYTFVAWDQRGCGRTYFHNLNDDSQNETASFSQALEDLDNLVDYALNRFGKDKVIILGHSYGTILGSEYVKLHPEKVSAYIGAAQVVSLEKMDIYSYEDALYKAKAEGDDTTELEEAFEAFRQDDSISNMMSLRHLTSKYHPVAVPDKATMLAVRSPYFGVDDFRWFLKQLGDIEDYWNLNRQLFEYTFDFDADARSKEYDMPVYFVSGSCDWICPVDSVQAYFEEISAVDKGIEIIDGCGHNLQYSSPEEFAATVREVLTTSR